MFEGFQWAWGLWRVDFEGDVTSGRLYIVNRASDTGRSCDDGENPCDRSDGGRYSTRNRSAKMGYQNRTAMLNGA